MVKKGDTLIEVTLAIGIFSMVAVAITSVVSSSAAGTQTALESTLTREEIDTQAEALRFIQSSYIINKSSNDNIYSYLWSAIKDNAVKDVTNSSVLQFSPTQCDDIYANGSSYLNNAFVVNPKKLSSNQVSDILIYHSNSADIFAQTDTFPHLTSSDSGSLSKAYGIYVVAVAEGINKTQPSYYDFYIRSCWYGANSNEPSTISTVIRLYNPDSI